MAGQNGTTAGAPGVVDEPVDLLGLVDHTAALLRGSLRLLERSAPYQSDTDLMYAGTLARLADEALDCVREVADERERQLFTLRASVAGGEG